MIETLRNDFNYQNHITAIEIDPKIIEIANEEFQLTSNKNLEIICDDALKYMKQNTTVFNLIIIDLFIDIEVPKQFLSISFWEDVLKAKSVNGCVIFNASLQKSKNEALEKVISLLQSSVYKVDVYKKVNNTNTIIIAQGL